MSHELDMREDGTAAMAYIGEVPWHRLGQELKAGATKEEWRKAAGFDFTFETAPVTFKIGESDLNYAAYPKRQVIYRSDNHEPMSIVSDGYKIVQPAAVLDYFDNLAKKAGFALNTAGVLFDGRQFWGLANLGADTYILDPQDKVKAFLLMATSVDLSMPTTFKFIMERVVCKNTLTYGLAESGRMVKVNHRTTFNEDEVNEALGITMLDRFDHMVNVMRTLAETPMDAREMISTSVDLFTPPTDNVFAMDHDDLLKVVNTKPLKRLIELTVQQDIIGADLLGGRGTAYAWLQGVTQIVDHEQIAATDDARLNKAWFGAGDALKRRAFDLLVDKYDLTGSK